MKFLEKSLFKVTNYLPCKIINDAGVPYLERYHLLSLGKNFMRGYIHRFVASDPDRGVHDHPWNYAVSFVLTGGYYEERLIDGEVVTRRVKPFSLNFIKGSDFHRVVMPEGQTCWSIFFHTNWVKGWGFMRPQKEGGMEYVAHKTDKEIKRHPWHKTALPGRYAQDRQPPEAA